MEKNSLWNGYFHIGSKKILEQKLIGGIDFYVNKSGRFGCCALQMGEWGRGGLGPDYTFDQKTTSFCFCFHSIQKPLKRVKTHKKNCKA